MRNTCYDVVGRGKAEVGFVLFWPCQTLGLGRHATLQSKYFPENLGPQDWRQLRSSLLAFKPLQISIYESW